MLTPKPSVAMFMFVGRVFILLPALELPPYIYHATFDDTYNSDILRVVSIEGDFKKKVTWKLAKKIIWSFLKDPTKVREYSFQYFYPKFSKIPNLKTLLDEAYKKICVFIPAYQKPRPYYSQRVS